jgi:uncharacterized protein involved in exopolysaccharide biosynthesis
MDEIKTPASAPVEAQLHFLDYWRVIRIRKAIIITVFLITAIIATAVTLKENERQKNKKNLNSKKEERKEKD